MRLSLRSSLVLLAVVLVTSSCVAFQRWQKRQTQKLREIELEDVAKSWCQTIRASQVVPVYPLTEDLMPGDVFLVQRTMDEQHEEYTQRGFLPFDYQVVRLAPSGYAKFYGHSVLPIGTSGAAVLVPRVWMRPDGSLPAAGQAWETAPRAAFPSYSFSVDAGGGFNLAIPVSGVPVGMSLMAAQSASGTISIKQAKTIGVDMLSLYADLVEWCEKNQDAVLPYVSTSERPSYLRAVTRVYLIGSIDVSLSASQSGAFGADAGVPKPVSLPDRQDTPEGQAAKTTAESYADNLKKINEALTAAAGDAGGSLRVTSATANTVSMHEKFDPPLVLGYLGFDCEILPGGQLGDPCPTRVTLENPTLAESLVQSDRGVAIYVDAINKETLRLIRETVDTGDLPSDLQRSGEAVLKQFDALKKYVESDFPVYKRDASGGVTRQTFAEADRGDETGYSVFTRFKGRLRSSATAIEKALRGASDDERPRLEADAARIEALREDAPWRDDEQDAVRSAFQWLSRFGVTAVD